MRCLRLRRLLFRGAPTGGHNMSSGSKSMAPIEAAGQRPGPNGENRMTVIDELIKDLGAGQVIVGSDIPARNSADASGLTPTPPQAVVLPRTTEDVSAALRDLPLARAAGRHSGRPDGPCGRRPPRMARSRCRWSAWRESRRSTTAASTLTALAGTPLQVIQQAAEEAGLMCGIDLGARG